MTIIPLTLLSLQDDGFHLLVEVVVFDHRFKAVWILVLLKLFLIKHY